MCGKLVWTLIQVEQASTRGSSLVHHDWVGGGVVEDHYGPEEVDYGRPQARDEVDQGAGDCYGGDEDQEDGEGGRGCDARAHAVGWPVW